MSKESAYHNLFKLPYIICTQIVTEDLETGQLAPGSKKRSKRSKGIKNIHKDKFGRSIKYGCQMCEQYIVYTPEELGNHINMKHYKLKRFYCYKCGKGKS